jgi:hypothetical protein
LARRLWLWLWLGFDFGFGFGFNFCVIVLSLLQHAVLQHRRLAADFLQRQFAALVRGALIILDAAARQALMGEVGREQVVMVQAVVAVAV